MNDFSKYINCYFSLSINDRKNNIYKHDIFYEFLIVLYTFIEIQLYYYN